MFSGNMQFTDWSVQAKKVYGPQLYSSLECPVCKLLYCPQSHVLFVKYFNNQIFLTMASFV